jgi:hypothetical protein
MNAPRVKVVATHLGDTRCRLRVWVPGTECVEVLLLWDTNGV